MTSSLAETPDAPATEATDEAPAPRRFEYQPALDGLRAIAVIAVLLFHHYDIGPDRSFAWSGGFLGVDAFFVLSGFLITSLLLTERHHTGSISLRDFWARRARRLLPALYLTILLAALLAVIGVVERAQLSDLRGDGLAALLYVVNWHNMGADRTILTHTWSLSVEEQWYLFWPLAFLGLFALTQGRKKPLMLVIGGVSIASAIAMAFLYAPDDTRRAYNGTDTRAHSLLVGAGLAVLLFAWKGPKTRRGRIVLETLGIVALAVFLLFVAFAGIHDDYLYFGGFLLIALVVAVVIAAAVQPEGVGLRRVLSWRPLVAIGLVSYGLYLFHLPVYEWIDEDVTTGLPLLALRLLAVGALAYLSYRFLEQPVRTRRRVTRRPVVVAIGAALVTGIVLLAATARAAPSSEELRTRVAYTKAQQAAPPGSTRVLVIGDANALLLGVRGGTYSDDGVYGTTYGRLSCGLAVGMPIIDGQRLPEDPKCARWERDYRVVVDAYDPDVVILMTGSSEIFDRQIGERTLLAGTPQLERSLTRQLDRAREVLTADGADLVLLSPPCPTDGKPDTATRTAWLGEVWRDYADAHGDDVDLVDSDTFLCPDGQPGETDDGVPVRDEAGFTEAGAQATWEWLADLARER